MEDIKYVPLFPLAILPLPGELVPLHIFEPRYRQLLKEMEEYDLHFGIFCTQETNHQKVGSWMRLESIIKRYKTGESDIIVRCEDSFTLHSLDKVFPGRLYPGGEVTFWKTATPPADEVLIEQFATYRQLKGIKEFTPTISTLEIAAELNLDLQERFKLLALPEPNKRTYVLNHLKFQTHLFRQEEKAKGIYHLN